MPSISARIPDEDEATLEAVVDLLDEDKSTVIRKALRVGLADLRRRVAIQRYQSGEISTNEAARLAGLSIADWLELAREHNLTTQLSPADLEADAEASSRMRRPSEEKRRPVHAADDRDTTRASREPSSGDRITIQGSPAQ